MSRKKVSVTAALVGVTLLTSLTASAALPAASSAPCTAATSPNLPPLKPTTLSDIEQAYNCVFANYYSGSTIDDRLMLTGAFAGLTQELDRHGLDEPDATMPALTGDRSTDWAAFSAVYQRVSHPSQDLAAATMNGMLASLNDNHVRWEHPTSPEPYGLGIRTTPAALAVPDEELPPLYISMVTGGPAAKAGLKAGDVIEAVDAAPPFVDGVVSAGAINLLNPQYPDVAPVQLTLFRPATGRTWSVTMRPTFNTASATAVVTRVAGDIADVTLSAFAPGAANQVLAAIAKLRARGVILDLRGNLGGSPVELDKLLSSFVHGKVWSYDCDLAGNCTANHTDDSVPLLNLPLVVLTDRDCASACDAFSGAVKDLKVGKLVGTRTAGVVSGPAPGYLLSDNSMITLPAKHEVGANHEILNGIGVAPDYFLPLTAQDVSTGQDPDLAKAISLF